MNVKTSWWKITVEQYIDVGSGYDLTDHLWTLEEQCHSMAASSSTRQSDSALPGLGSLVFCDFWYDAVKK